MFKVIHGDSRTDLPDGPFDLVVTSPPYNVGKDYTGHEDTLSVAGWRALVTTVLRESWDRLVVGGRLCVNVQHGVGRSPMIPLGFHVEGIGHNLPGALYRGAVVWHKGPVNTTAWGSWQSPSNPVLRGTYEMVYIWSKEEMRRDGGAGDLSGQAFTEATLDMWMIPAEQSRVVHPAPFPVALAERLIRLYTWPGDRVLDPFMGSGSSGVASVRCGRDWVGVDTSAEYCTVARQRLTATHNDPNDIVELNEELEGFCIELSTSLALGARAGDSLEIRRFIITGSDSWERYRRTLSNHAQVGAYAVMRRTDGSRVGWTTSHGRSQSLTLERWTKKPVKTIRATTIEGLERAVLHDARRMATDASPDRRTRHVTVRGLEAG